MKSKITLLWLAACCVLKIDAQTMLIQNFNSTASVTANTGITINTGGWIRQNNSSPAGSTSWFIGNPSVFPALSGPDSAYFAANYNSTTGSTGTISTWLISPTVTIANGGIFQFATRTNTTSPTQTVSPDRLELYLSQGTGTNVGTTSTSLGTFSTMLVSVNPALTATAYPNSWTVYTATLSGITGTVTGRFGFRYFVTSAGPTGTNSSYIGIDNVNYGLPCANPTLSIASSTNAICSGNLVNLTGSGATTYTWSNTGQTTSSIAVSPTATTIYTLNASSIPNCNSSQTVAVSVTLTPILSAMDVTTCPGTAATLAVSGATSYSWSTGATTSSVAVTPTASTIYSVTGTTNGCTAVELISVTLGTSLSINPSTTQSVICNGVSTTLTASGANTYSWNPGTNSQSITVSPSVTTVYTVNASSGSCLGMGIIIIIVNPSPSVTVTGPTSGTICPITQFTVSAAGANTYSWLANSSTSSVATLSASTAGIYTYSVVGTGTNSCSKLASITVTISACTGIESYTGNKTISVFPNPFSNEIKIAGLSGDVEIYDALGQLVLKQAAGSSSAINTSELIKGIYILKAYSSDNKLAGTAKIIKN